MRILNISLLLLFGLFAACHNRVNTYENNLGIEPSVIAQIDTPNYTTIKWEDTLQNFGMAKAGDSIFVNFRFKNTGNKALFISEVYPSCGCTVADYPRQAIMPGESGELKATFNSHGIKGFVHKDITVTTNTSNKLKQLLLFTGEVRDSLPPPH